MDVREKLVELLKTSACPSTFICDPTCKYYGFEDCFPERFADYLIANGVTVQACKLGVKQTNADRIRAMSDEELAMFLCNFRSYNADVYICEGCKAEQYCHAGHTGTIDWLQQPAEKVNNG